MDGEVGAFREVLAQQAVRVLVRSPLPRRFGVAEVDLDAGSDRELGMLGHLLALIPCQRLPEMIREALSKTGYDKIVIEGMEVRIPEEFSLDFNAIAQGYTVDVLAEMLEQYEIMHYMVEVGGEVRTKGVNANEQVWTIGVDKPQETIDPQDRFQFIIGLENSALATSGNYRKFWVDQDTGLKYSHTINPETGRPAKNRLLSASIIASTAMDADAYATTCMVQGLEDCKAMLTSQADLDGYLVFTDDEGNWQTYITDGMNAMVK